MKRTLSKTRLQKTNVNNQNEKITKQPTKSTIKKPIKKKRKTIEIQYENTPPKHWLEVYNGISKMRKEQVAPVDTMGCATWGGEDIPPAVSRYHTLISLMLSSQTRDQVVGQVMKRLIEHGLTVDNIINTDQETLKNLLVPACFYSRKAQYIKKTSEILKQKYNSDIPDTIDKICSLPGVGPKMAHLLMTHAWNKVVGIGVDVHVHRICNRLGWVPNTSTPEQTRAALEAWLPREYWGVDGINKLLVGFGQTICKPVGPACDKCKVSKYCPSAFNFKKFEKSKK